jgi:hypothetical protein
MSTIYHKRILEKECKGNDFFNKQEEGAEESQAAGSFFSNMTIIYSFTVVKVSKTKDCFHLPEIEYFSKKSIIFIFSGLLKIIPLC